MAGQARAPLIDGRGVKRLLWGPPPPSLPPSLPPFLPFCLPSFLLPSFLRSTRRRLRAPPHIRDAVHHARPQFAVRKVPCRPRAAPLLQVHIGGVGAENGPANSISQKRALSLAVHPLVSGYFPSRPFPFLPRRLPCSDRRSTTTRACLAATES